MGTTRKSVQITHEELQIAIRKFQRNGGIIRKLPDQKVYTHRAVGSMGGHAGFEIDPDLAL
jgi:hypothetical protein